MLDFFIDMMILSGAFIVSAVILVLSAEAIRNYVGAPDTSPQIIRIEPEAEQTAETISRPVQVFLESTIAQISANRSFHLNDAGSSLSRTDAARLVSKSTSTNTYTHHETFGVLSEVVGLRKHCQAEVIPT